MEIQISLYSGLLETERTIAVSHGDDGVITLLLHGGFGTFRWNGHQMTGDFHLDDSDPFTLTTFLKFVLAIYYEKSGILLHSSGVIWREEVWLFSGPSGVGKSTIANELRCDGALFSEDVCVVTMQSDQEMYAHATPFGDDRQRIDAVRSAPLAGIVFIQQSTETRVCNISTMDALRRLYRETRFFERDLISNQYFLNVVQNIVASGMCCNLEFRKDKLFWPKLEQWRLNRGGRHE